MSESWSNLAKIVYRRTYSRADSGKAEDWPDTVRRVISGNIRQHPVSEEERAKLEHFLLNRKAMPAGRGLWFSGSPAHSRLGGAALNNCWFVQGDDWQSLVLAQDMLMLGGGVGISIEKRFVSKLPKVKRGVRIEHRPGDARSFAVPDSREGWCELNRRVLESYFVTGKSFSYSTHLVRPKGSPIRGFGGAAGGPEPLVACVEKLSRALDAIQGIQPRGIHLMDLICIIGEMVVSGNVRRSALLILGDADDEEYLRAKRWDLGPIPTQRAMANLSVVVEKPEELGQAFWETYEHGEPFGIVNRATIRRFGRMGELKPDDAIGVNPCAEATLTHAEPCNLQEIFLPHLRDEEEFVEAARLMHRWGKRVTCERYSTEETARAVEKYRRIGTGITGCLQSPLFKAEILDRVYAAIQDENARYSKELGINESIRTTVIKPSGTLSLLGDCLAGIHPAFSRYYIRRVRFSSDDPILPLLRSAGHTVEPVIRFDGMPDFTTQVADFYLSAPEGAPLADDGWDTLRQLEVVKFAQRHWADQAVSVTVYYRRDEIPMLKEWLRDNLGSIKTLSFLCHSDHGFKQPPLEAVSREEYERQTARVKPIDLSHLEKTYELLEHDCEGRGCPIK